MATKDRDKGGWLQGWSTEKLPQGIRLQITSGSGPETATAAEIILTFEEARELGEWLFVMETIDLTAYRPADSPALLDEWRKAGLWGMLRNQNYLVYLRIGNPVTLTGLDGAAYLAGATADFHIKRSDKAKVHEFYLVINYQVSERDHAYTLKMNSHHWGRLDAVPVDFPSIFPDRGESVYDGLLYAYSEFWRAVMRPFVGVRHFELHGDNPEERLYLVAK
jgi:hypothetical protein